MILLFTSADFGRPSVLEMPLSDQMKVYLRIRPFAKDEIEKNEDQVCHLHKVLIYDTFSIG